MLDMYNKNECLLNHYNAVCVLINTHCKNKSMQWNFLYYCKMHEIFHRVSYFKVKHEMYLIGYANKRGTSKHVPVKQLCQNLKGRKK